MNEEKVFGGISVSWSVPLVRKSEIKMLEESEKRQDHLNIDRDPKSITAYEETPR